MKSPKKSSALPKPYKIGIATVTIFVGLVLLGAGTAYAANPSTPADALYPVDTFAESVRRIFTFGTVNKANYEIKVMDERVSELKKLSEDGAGDDEINECLQEMTQERIRLQERIQDMEQLRTENKIQTKDATEVMQRLQTSLQNQTQIMTEVQTRLNNQGNSGLGNSVNTQQTQNTNQLQTRIQDFEDSTGVQVQENESNQGDETQIRNENQTQTQNQNGK